MSSCGEFGLKIKNIEAGSLYEFNLGVRDRLDTKDAMFTNSLFKDFICEHGMSIWKGVSTRDIICLNFQYGSRSYDEEVKHIQKLIRGLDKEEISEEIREEKLAIFNSLKEKADCNKDKYDKKSRDQIREIYYVNGCDVTYNVYSSKSKGLITGTETIHYKMLYRSAGKAKKGSCMFIREELYDIAKNFLTMGIQLPEHNSPIVEMGAYSSLIASTIVGRIRINPRNILILKDVDSFFITNVVSVETDNQKNCCAVLKENYRMKNTLFDGQALIEHRLFPSWADGYILLRHHLCKMATFDTHLQKFFREYYGEKYETATITDMFGVVHKVKDIELVTTDNAMKWLKFDISYDYWAKWVEANGSLFGIVKTSHKSKLGEVQQMSYQMVNALDMESMPSIAQYSHDYIERLKYDDNTFLEYLESNSNYSNDFEVLIALCKQNPYFVQSSYFRERKYAIIQAYVLNFKTGKVIQNADNLTIVGSPYAMLLYTVGENPENDMSFKSENGTIQCWTSRFKNGEYLAEFRNPFNSQNNLGYLHNVYNEVFDKYFRFGEQIIAINMIHTDFQDRNNGSDQDSDSLYVTNHPEIVKCAKKCYEEYPTIVNNIPKEKNIYDNTLKDYAFVDSGLAASQIAIGESSNLAQICLTYTYNFDDDKFKDYVCILSVLAQLAIDSAKRKFDIDIVEQIKRIKEDMNIKEHGYPVFWLGIRKGFNKNKINYDLKCPMNYIYNMNFNTYKKTTPTIPMDRFFIKYKLDGSTRKSKKVEELILKYSLNMYLTEKYKSYESSEYSSEVEEHILLRSDFDDLVNDIRNLYISNNYLGLMSWLIDRAFLITTNLKNNKKKLNTSLRKNKSLLLKVLYDVNSKAFLQCFSNDIN